MLKSFFNAKSNIIKQEKIKKPQIVESQTSNIIWYFYNAICWNKISIVNTLLSDGMDPNIIFISDNNYYDCTPLHIAARYGRATIIKALLKGGANKEVEDGKGFTPLAIAIEENMGIAVKELLNNGSNIFHPSVKSFYKIHYNSLIINNTIPDLQENEINTIFLGQILPSILQTHLTIIQNIIIFLLENLPSKIKNNMETLPIESYKLAIDKIYNYTLLLDIHKYSIIGYLKEFNMRSEINGKNLIDEFIIDSASLFYENMEIVKNPSDVTYHEI